METIGRALAMELWPVRVNVVSPGMTDTSMLDMLLGAEMTPMLNDAMAPSPAACVSNADDVANAALFLMSAGAVTGEVLHVDGSGRWAGNSGSLEGLTFRAPLPGRAGGMEQYRNQW
jgi:NAD(P)-dependent dehydrogenase (short-subunit alcohol dehydrogenase family)